MMNGYFSNLKQLRRLALLGVVMALSACSGGSDSTGTTSPPAVLGASEVVPVSGQTTVVGPEAGGAAFAEGDPARNSMPTLTRVKNTDVATLFEAEKSTLMTEGAADYEILIKFPVFPTGDSTITVTVPDALASKVTSSNAIVAYVINGDISEPSPFDPVASNYDPSTNKLSFFLPKDYLSESAAGSGFAGEVTVKIGLAKTFDAEPTTTGTSPKSLGTSAYQTTLGFGVSKKLPCPVDGSNGCIETSRYGPRTGGSGPMHIGIDFQASTPIKLFAVADGIIEIPKGFEWGTVDIVSGMTRYRYMHLSRTDVTNGQKVKAKDVIGLSGNKSPPKKKDGTPLKLDPHLHFEIWEPRPIYYIMAPSLETQAPRAGFIMAKVDPFPYFIDKVSVDIPGNKTPGDTTVTGKFVLELKGYDIGGRPVTTEIDNSDPKFISRVRPVTWAASIGSVTKQEKYESSFHKSLGTYQISKDPKKRNLADIVMPSSEVNATVTAAWEGVMPEAKYTLSSSMFYRITMTPYTCETTHPVGWKVGDVPSSICNSVNFMRSNDPYVVSIREGDAAPNSARLDASFNIPNCRSSESGSPITLGRSTFNISFRAYDPLDYKAHQVVAYNFTRDTPAAMTGTFEAPMLASAYEPKPFSEGVVFPAKIVGRWSMIPINAFPKCFRESTVQSNGNTNVLNLCYNSPLATCDWRAYSSPARESDWPR